MYPISGRAMREPRQPVKEKGALVYSTESPQQVAVTRMATQREAMEREAAASVALDGETQSFDEPQEEPVKKERTKLPIGEQGNTVVSHIRQSIIFGSTFDAQKVWYLFDASTKARWINAYGGTDAAIGKVRHAISNVDHGRRIQAYSDGHGNWVRGEKPRIATVEDTAPVELDHETTPEGDLGDYMHIGTSLDGDPLYLDRLTNTPGTLVFTPLDVVST